MAAVVNVRKSKPGKTLGRPYRCFLVTARLLLDPQNRVLCGLGNTKFDDGLGWNLDLLLRLWIKARARLPLLLHQLAKTGQDGVVSPNPVKGGSAMLLKSELPPEEPRHLSAVTVAKA